MSAPVISMLLICVLLWLMAAASGRLQESGVIRRVSALDSRGGLDAAAPTPVGNAAGHSSALRAPRRWGGAPPGDWAVTLEGLAREVRTGSSLASALIGTDDLPSPLLQRAVQRHAVGVPLAEALATDRTRPEHVTTGFRARWAGARGPATAHDRAADEAFALAALQVAATVGGNVAATLDGAASTLRERRAIRDDRAVHSAQARMSARVLSVLPIAFAVWCVSTDGRVARFLLSSPAGWACLATGAFLNLTGWWWMRRIIGSVGRSA